MADVLHAKQPTDKPSAHSIIRDFYPDECDKLMLLLVIVFIPPQVDQNIYTAKRKKLPLS